MEYSSVPWLQATPLSDLQSIHDERTSSTSDDWKEQDASMHGVGSDLLADLGEHESSYRQTPVSCDAFSVPPHILAHTRRPVVPNAPSNATNSPGSHFFSLNNIPHVFLPPTSPFNTPYNSSQWSSSSTQVPLSNYSSLNGATSTMSHAQQQSSSASPMAIELRGSPSAVTQALTSNSPGLMSAPSSSPPQQFQQSPFLSQSLQRMPYPYSQQSHSPPLSSLNPSYVHANSSHYPQSQSQPSIPLPRTHSHSPPQPQSQGTLSPFVLHTTGSTYFPNGIPPSSFYGQPAQSQAGPSTPQTASQSVQHSPQAQQASPPPSKVSPEQRKAELTRDIKPLIQPTSFTGAGAVLQLVNLLDDFGISDVDAATRLEILTKIRDNAGNHYFRAWVDNTIAMEIVREWLKMAFVGRNDSQSVETIMPILHVSVTCATI